MHTDDVPDGTGSRTDGPGGMDDPGPAAGGQRNDDSPTVPVAPAGQAGGAGAAESPPDTATGGDDAQGGPGGTSGPGGTGDVPGSGDAAGPGDPGGAAGTGAGPGGDGPHRAGWPPPPGYPWPGRRLRRSRGNRMVAGVAGGIGEHLGVDPVVARVAFAVLTVFGGSGVLLYLLCWFFMPGEGEEHAPVDGLLGRGRRQGGAVREAALVAAAGFLLAALLVRRHADDFLLVAVVLVLAFLLFRHLDGGAAPAPSDAPVPPPDTRWVPVDRPWPGGQGPVQHGARTVTAPTGAGGGAGGHRDVREVHEAREVHGSRDRRQRSVLGVAAFCAVLVLAGVLAALDRASEVTVSPRTALALVLAAIGAALVVGAWWGRARGLVALGLPVALVLMFAGDTLLGSWQGDDTTWSPSAVADVHDEYRLGAGRAVLDLRSVDFSDSDVRTTVRMGAGLLRVELPPDVDVVVHSSVTAGSVDGFGRHVEGFNRNADLVDTGRDGPGGGRLDLRTTMDFGAVQVVR